jgi:hypothetical protein
MGLVAHRFCLSFLPLVRQSCTARRHANEGRIDHGRSKIYFASLYVRICELYPELCAIVDVIDRQFPAHIFFDDVF